jgi:hypothetical protein
MTETQNHPDTNKMTPADLRSCYCQFCQEALRLHELLNQLIESSKETDRALTKLENTVTEMTRRIGEHAAKD